MKVICRVLEVKYIENKSRIEILFRREQTVVATNDSRSSEETSSRMKRWNSEDAPPPEARRYEMYYVGKCTGFFICISDSTPIKGKCHGRAAPYARDLWEEESWLAHSQSSFFPLKETSDSRTEAPLISCFLWGGNMGCSIFPGNLFPRAVLRKLFYSTKCSYCSPRRY